MGGALLLSACGADANGAGGQEIVIGVVASETGALASTDAGLRDLAEGWASWVNRTHGGINGRPVKVIVVDDASTAATGVARVRQLVERDKVIALVGSFTSVSVAASASYLEQRKIANIVAVPNTQTWTKSPVHFPVSATVPNSVIAKAVVAKASGAKKWGAFICAESPACDVSAIWSGVSGKLGLDYFGSEKIAASAPSYAAQCLELKQAGVDYVQVGVPVQVAMRAIRDCQQQGYQPKWGIQTVAWDPGLLEIPGLRVSGDAYTLPWFSDQPGLATYKQLEKTYVPEASWRSFTSVASFAALEIFRKAMTGAGDNPTSDDVLKAMAALSGEDLGGLLPKKVGGFNPGTGPQPALNCVYQAGIEDGKYVASDAKPLCVDVTA